MKKAHFRLISVAQKRRFLSFLTFCSFRPIQDNPRESSILDSTLWIVDSRYWIPDSLSIELGLRIPNAEGFRISGLSSGFQGLNSRFQSPKFPIPRAKDFLDSGLPYMVRLIETEVKQRVE